MAKDYSEWIHKAEDKESYTERMNAAHNVSLARRARRIPNRIKADQTTIKVAVNSQLHVNLGILSQCSGTPIARDFGLGSPEHGWLCQQMELCGFVKRSYKEMPQLEYRQVRPGKKLTAKEVKHQRALGTYPDLEDKEVVVKRKRVCYQITDVGLSALHKLDLGLEANQTQPSGPSEGEIVTIGQYRVHHQSTVTGYKYITVDIKIDPAVHKRMVDRVW